MLFGRLRTPLRLYTDYKNFQNFCSLDSFGTVQKKEVKREFNLFKNENFSTPDSLFTVSRYK